MRQREELKATGGKETPIWLCSATMSTQIYHPWLGGGAQFLHLENGLITKASSNANTSILQLQLLSQQ